MEKIQQFESRKRDHVTHSLREEIQARELADWDRVQLLPEALPDLNFQDITLQTQVLGQTWSSPIFISSMTAGHPQSLEINLRLAKAASSRGWMMGVGSQRRELSDPDAASEWKEIRRACPDLKIFGNIGITQVITSPVAQIVQLAERMQATGLFVHTNPLQEALQIEGTPQFRGGLEALKRLCGKLKIPVVLKEVGGGFAPATLQRLRGVGLAAVDVAGAGGTHWGRMEMARRKDRDAQDVFGNSLTGWGLSTVDSLWLARDLKLDYELWGSGGVRNALNVAQAIALGAKAVGLAKPCLDWAIKDINLAAKKGPSYPVQKGLRKSAKQNPSVSKRNSTGVPKDAVGELPRQMDNMERELRTLLFCTGSRSPQQLDASKVRMRWGPA